jgi:uncharacterized protein YndB with AHSA1/START domain
MRLSEQPSVTVETTIEAAPDDVFRVLSNLETLAGFGTEFQSCRWVGGRPGTLGSSFIGVQRMGENEWESTSTITTLEADRAFAWTVGDAADPVATWTFNQRVVPDGTEVRYTVVIGTAPSGLSDAIERHPDSEEKIIDKRLMTFQENMVKTLEGIRRLVERR